MTDWLGSYVVTQTTTLILYAFYPNIPLYAVWFPSLFILAILVVVLIVVFGVWLYHWLFNY